MNEDRTLLPDPAAARFTREGLPSVIGAYRILQLLGEGGMGAVYLAEQQHPKRTVALKVIKAGLAGTEFLLRFHREPNFSGACNTLGSRRFTKLARPPLPSVRGLSSRWSSFRASRCASGSPDGTWRRATSWR